MKYLITLSSLFILLNSLAQNVNVSFPEHKALWFGYNNIIEICSNEEVVLEGDSTLVIKRIKDNTFSVVPVTFAKYNYDEGKRFSKVTFKTTSGDFIKDELYPVYNLPKPEIIVSTKFGGPYLSRKIEKISLKRPYFDFQDEFEIIDFELIVKMKTDTTVLKGKGSDFKQTLQGVCDTLNEQWSMVDVIASIKDKGRGVVLKVAESFLFDPETILHPNGKVAIEKGYNGTSILEGDWVYYYDNGQLWKKEHWVDGVIDDKCDHHYLTQFHPNGNILEESKCLKDGTVQFTRYYENGKKEIEGAMSFINGWYIGKIKRYNNKGKLTCTEVFDKDGGLISSKGDCK